jgi:transposase
METSAALPGPEITDLGSGKRGLKHGINLHFRTVVLMLDETIVTETPPRGYAYGHIGSQLRVPITGNRSKRIIHGVINIHSGEIDLLISWEWNAQSSMHFLEQIRSRWRGWHIILFEDRGSPHTAEESVELAENLGIELRFLPRAAPELNPMDQLWKFVKRETLASRSTVSIDQSALLACRYLIQMSRRERLRKAGVLSGNFWLTT